MKRLYLSGAIDSCVCRTSVMLVIHLLASSAEGPIKRKVLYAQSGWRTSLCGVLSLQGCKCRLGGSCLRKRPKHEPVRHWLSVSNQRHLFGHRDDSGHNIHVELQCLWIGQFHLWIARRLCPGSITPGATTSGTVPNNLYIHAISFFVDTFTFNGTTTCGGTPCALTGSGTIQMEFDVTSTVAGLSDACVGVAAGSSPSSVNYSSCTPVSSGSSTVILSQPLAITFRQAATFTVGLLAYGSIVDFADSKGGFTVKANSALIGFVVKDSNGNQLTKFSVGSGSGTAYLAATVSQNILPQLAFGGGWYSALYFTNTSISAVSFSVNFTADNGTPLSIPSVGGASTTVSLAPLATAIIEAPNNGPLNQGYASFFGSAQESDRVAG
jgi:hypothetical protein